MDKTPPFADVWQAHDKWTAQAVQGSPFLPVVRTALDMLAAALKDPRELDPLSKSAWATLRSKDGGWLAVLPWGGKPLPSGSIAAQLKSAALTLGRLAVVRMQAAGPAALGAENFNLVWSLIGIQYHKTDDPDDEAVAALLPPNGGFLSFSPGSPPNWWFLYPWALTVILQGDERAGLDTGPPFQALAVNGGFTLCLHSGAQNTPP